MSTAVADPRAQGQSTRWFVLFDAQGRTKLRKQGWQEVSGGETTSTSTTVFGDASQPAIQIGGSRPERSEIKIKTYLPITDEYSFITTLEKSHGNRCEIFAQPNQPDGTPHGEAYRYQGKLTGVAKSGEATADTTDVVTVELTVSVEP